MNVGKIILKDIKKLLPLNRSITGKGTKKTLIYLKDILKKLKIKKIETGSKCFDWKIPPEWEIKDAWIKDEKNKKIIDFKKSNLHVVGYS